MIRFEQVSVTYGDAATPAVQGIDLTVPEGELCLLVGPSGVGKSTVLNAVCGLVPHFTGGTLRGRVTVAGRDTRTHKPRELADVVGTVGQDPLAHFVTDTVEDELAYGMESLGLAPEVMRRRVEETLDLLGLAELRDRAIATLSGGQQQRVAIGSVLTTHPKVLVLDEPTSALDPAAAEEVLAVLQRLVHDLGTTVLLAEHRLERVVQYADQVILLPAPGAPPLMGSPADIMAVSPVHPPVVALGRLAHWSPLPLSVRDARRKATALRDRLTGVRLPEAVSGGSLSRTASHRLGDSGPGTGPGAEAARTPGAGSARDSEPTGGTAAPGHGRWAADEPATGRGAGAAQGTGPVPGVGPMADHGVAQRERAASEPATPSRAGSGRGAADAGQGRADEARGDQDGASGGARASARWSLFGGRSRKRRRAAEGAEGSTGPVPAGIRPSGGAEADAAAVGAGGAAAAAAPGSGRVPATGGTPVAEAAGLCVRRGRIDALHRVDLAVRAGETIALMGRNGAGKSTLLTTFVGMHEPAAGSVRVGGAAPHRTGPRALLRLVGLVPQEPRDLLYADTVAAECAAADHDADATPGTCRALVSRLLPGVPDDTHPRDLSEGQRLALALAVILTARPPLLLLDEPTRGLDYAAKARLVEVLRELAAEGHAIVLATHDVELAAELAHRVVILADGEVVADGPTAEVVVSSPSFAPQVAKILAPLPWLTVPQVAEALEATA